MLSAIIDKLRSAISPEKREETVMRPLLDKQRTVPLPQLGGKYTLRITPIETRKGCWNYLAVEILDTATQKVLGGYRRNYGSFYDTFYPFKQGDKEYALYSREYTATRVMSLPDCVDLTGEDDAAFGFCPTGFYVPQPGDTDRKDPNADLDGTFGFVCGCVWGDDSSWKIQYLDLADISKGKVVRDARLGYIEMPSSAKTLKDCFDFAWYDAERRNMLVTTQVEFDLRRRVDIDFSNLTGEVYEKQRNEEDPTRQARCKNCRHVGRFHAKLEDRNSCRVYSKEKNGACDCDNFDPDMDDREED